MEYDVIFTGEMAHADAPEVKERLAQILKLSPEEVESLFLKAPMVIKKGVPRDVAEKIAKAISDAGVTCVIRESEPKEDMPSPAEDAGKEGEAPGERLAPSAHPNLPGIIFAIILLILLGAVGYRLATTGEEIRTLDKEAVSEKVKGTLEKFVEKLEKTYGIKPQERRTAPTPPPAERKEDAARQTEQGKPVAEKTPAPEEPGEVPPWNVPVPSGTMAELFPLPEWWSEVEAPELSDMDDFYRYWRDRKRTPRQFFKAAFSLMLKHSEEEEYVVGITHLLPYGDREYPRLLTLHEYVLSKYFGHGRSRAGYPGKSGDTIASIAESAVSMYISIRRYEDAIALSEKVIGERGKEINDHLLERVTIGYALALAESGRKGKAVKVLEAAIRDYNGDWERDLRRLLGDISSR